MATMKLYPPTLAGTVPPFYGTSLEVPFSMNRTVSLSEVNAMYLRIKDANTDTEYGILSTAQIEDWTAISLQDDITLDSSQINSKLGMCLATFDISSIQKRLIVGNYYKIQLAYQDKENDVIGYYSTVAITKYTTKPQVYIEGLEENRSNTNIYAYNGIYRNVNDSSEKCHQYKFEVFDDSKTNVLVSTGWCYHNSNKDTSSTESNDTYNFIYNLSSSDVAYMRYTVRTNNEAIYSSPFYPIVSTAQISSSITAHLSAALDYNNGSIDVYLEPDQAAILSAMIMGSENKTSYVGRFVISRSSSLDNYTIWLPLYTFELTGNLPSDVIFRDFTGVHGETYQYCLQQFNKYGIYSARICTDYVTCNFEDAYLFDGKRQLRIRFNPKISSFKTVLQENKKTTLGAQYPFFFRSGNVKYKEFPISGLISYIMDENQFFLSREEDLGMSPEWLDSFDITDKNLTYERKFKLAVLDWLNDGSIKLFRSPAEGNYMVRLMNTSLSSNDSVSRMISTFSTTAVEALEYSNEALQEYGFLAVDLTIPQVLQFYTIDLATLTYNADNYTLSKLGATDLLQGFACEYIHIDGVMPSIGSYYSARTRYNLHSTSANWTEDAVTEGMNAFFSLGGPNRTGQKFVIGVTGQYEAYFDTPQRFLYLMNPHKNMQGTITVGILAQNTTWFDSVSNLSTVDIFDFREYIGVNWMSLWHKQYNAESEEQSFYNSKDQIIKIYLAQFELATQVYHIESLDVLQQQYDLYLSPLNSSSTIYTPQPAALIKTDLHSGSTVQTYSPYTIYEVRYDQNKIYDETTASESWYSDIEGRSIAKNAKDIFVPGAMFVTEHYVHQVKRIRDLTINEIVDQITNNGHQYEEFYEEVDDGVTVWQYRIDTSSSAVNKYFIQMPKKTITDELGNQLNLSATQIYIDGQLFDIGETGFLRIENMDTIPNIIQWGAQVTGTFFFRLATIDYAAEDEVNVIDNNKRLKKLYTLYDYGRQFLAAQELKLARKVITSSVNGKVLYNKVSLIDNNGNQRALYEWVNGTFVHLNPDRYAEMTSGEYWVSVTQSEYNTQLEDAIYHDYSKSGAFIEYNDSVLNLGSSQYYTATNLMSNFTANRYDFFTQLNQELATRAVEQASIGEE